MDGEGIRRFLPVVIIVALIGLAVFGLFSFGGGLFGSSAPAEPTSGQRSLINTNVGRSVELKVRGPILSEENQRSYEIVISPTGRTMTVYKGFSGEVLKNETFTNSQAAYEEFVYSLDRAGMMSGAPLSGDADDTRGLCATGRLYEFSTLNGTSSVQRNWTTTCRQAAGSLTANRGTLTDLFLKQIPTQQSLLSGTRL